MSRKKSQTTKSGVLEPVYALLGATEMATEALRRLGSDATTDETEPTARPLFARLKGDVSDIARGTTRVPGLAVEEARGFYGRLAERGQKTVAGALPVVDKARRDGQDKARSEEAKARREARRLARQAGATVTRGRAMATQAAEDATKTAERTIEAVRAEAGQVVEAVTHPGRIKSRPVPGTVRRRSAVSDTAVTSTSPVGGDPEAKSESAVAGGVEAAAATIGRRSPKVRRTVEEAEKTPRKSVSRRTPTTATTTDATTVVAKKAKSKAAAPVDAVSEKVWTSETPTPDAQPSESAPKAPETQEASVPQAEHAAPAHSDIPTPADVAKTVESSHHDG